MPPRIRTRASKALKENIGVSENKLKSVKNTVKAPRKALADKTNSASDDVSSEIPTKPKKTITKISKTVLNKNGENKLNVVTKQKQTAKLKENAEPTNEVRPRRDRRLPNRFVQNTVLNNLSNSKDTPNVTNDSSITIPKASDTPENKESSSKSDEPQSSPFKTPAKADSSLLVSRPRRICRLPSRFEDHSISPNKFIPIQPTNASTPIQQSKTKPVVALNNNKNVNKNVSKDVEKKPATVARPTRLAKINALQKKLSENSSDTSSPDSNNNAKGRSSRKKTKTQPPATKKQSPTKKNESPIRKFLTPMSRLQSFANKSQSPIKKISPEQSIINKVDKNLSFKLLESKKTSQENDSNVHDIYEFTFDPDEEPKPQKKKRKKTVTKKPTAAPTAMPKKAVYKSRYELNISKALATLKSAVKSGNAKETAKLPQITETSDEVAVNVVQNNVAKNFIEVQTTNATKENNIALNDTGKNSVHECNYPSIRVEDIAADIEPSIDHHDDINYSPVNSPRPNELRTPSAHESVTHRETPERSVHNNINNLTVNSPRPNELRTPNAHESVNHSKTPEKTVHNNDPLNLIEEFSFFDEQPAASSSMNTSVRHPLASPWRVEFNHLPIKWHVNTYVKPNMTPAVECSFINPEESNKKKHVYTNMLPETNDNDNNMFTDIVDNDNTPNLKQTSIISFIKEMAEKSAKKKRGRSVSPFRTIYQEIGDINGEANKNKTPVKKPTSNKATLSTNNTSEEVSSSYNDASHDKENSKEDRRSRKRKNNENICHISAKSPRKQKDKDCTFFGFDESENHDENASPIKINDPKRSLRSRSKAVLQEINGPTRAALPVAAKTKIATSSDAVNKISEDLKAAADAPVFPENNVNDNATNIADPEINDDSQSVHLFEDIEFIHHLKPLRKSYGKAKKVTFPQYSSSDSDTQEAVAADPNESSDYDDLGDLTFEIPNVKEKKVTKKKKPKNLRSKKEEKEAEAWAANFNSMCEDVEEFPLVVE